MLHQYKMKKFIVDQCLFLFIGLGLMGYLLFVLRRNIWFAVLLDCIIVLPLLYVCRRLILLPIDMLLRPKTEELRFSAKANVHELQFSREFHCFEWEFRDDKSRALRLLIPEATKQDSITQPKKDRLLRVSYYRLSRLLLGWEIIEESKPPVEPVV